MASGKVLPLMLSGQVVGVEMGVPGSILSSSGQWGVALGKAHFVALVSTGLFTKRK